MTPLYDMALSFAASADDPISGGRHKVLGCAQTFVPPQTSTIASHLPKAVGAAHSIGMAQRLKLADAALPHDGIILCSFGDASANHSTSQGAFNAACWAAYQHLPMPIVFLCEDNGIGISVRTPGGWIEANFAHRPALHYIQCDGADLNDALRGCEDAVDYARVRRRTGVPSHAHGSADGSLQGPMWRLAIHRSPISRQAKHKTRCCTAREYCMTRPGCLVTRSSRGTMKCALA